MDGAALQDCPPRSSYPVERDRLTLLKAFYPVWDPAAHCSQVQLPSRQVVNARDQARRAGLRR